MADLKRETIKQENEYRSSVRRTLLTIGTPILTVVVLGLLLAVSTITSTFFAAQKFETATSLEQLNKVVEDINLSAYTSSFVEGYKAKYNYATAIGVSQPQNAVNLYASEVIPLSPPEFICYPVLNGLHYSTMLGDQAMEVGSFLEAEHYYNYGEFFMMSAPHCFDGGGGGSSDEGEESSGDEQSEEESGEGSSDSEDGEQSEEYKEKQEELKDKKNEARKAQGKEARDGEPENKRPTEEQKAENEQRTDASEKSQRDTKDVREAEKEGEGPTYTDKPW